MNRKNYQNIIAEVEGQLAALHFIQLIDVYEAEDDIQLIEFSAVEVGSQRTAHGRMILGELLDEATWIWVEEMNPPATTWALERVEN